MNGVATYPVVSKSGSSSNRTSRTDTYSAEITTPAERIGKAAGNCKELVHPLYALFDFFQPAATLYSEELGRMQRREP